MAYYQAYPTDRCPVDPMDRCPVDPTDLHQAYPTGRRRDQPAVLRCLRLPAMSDWSEPDRRYNGS